MRILILLFAWFFVFLSCKRLDKESPSVPMTSATAVYKDTWPKVEKKQHKNIFFNVGLDTLKTINLPIGSEQLVSQKFPEKFGLDDDEYLDHFDGTGEENPETIVLSKIINQNKSYLISNNTNEEHLSATIDYNYNYGLVARDTTHSKKNLKVIGKISYGQNTFILCSLIHDTLPLYSSILLYSINSNKSVKDVIVLFDEQVDYIATSTELFHIDKNFLINKKYYYSFEGMTNYDGERLFTINVEGYFIRYYKTNGRYKNDKEQGLVKNNTRDGLWIIKNNNSPGDTGHLTYIETNYKNGQPLGKWNYYMLNYKRTTEGEPDMTTATKGALLYTETYENGEMVRRDMAN